MTDLCDKITQNCFFNPLTNTVHITVELHVKEIVGSTMNQGLAIIPEKYRPKENVTGFCYINFKDGSYGVSGLADIRTNGEIAQYTTGRGVGYLFFLIAYVTN